MVLVNYWYFTTGPTLFGEETQEVWGSPAIKRLYHLAPIEEHVAIRQQLEAWEDDGTAEVIGAWDVYTGQPMGGVGSPWFVTPQAFNDYSARELAPRQAPRIFV